MGNVDVNTKHLFNLATTKHEQFPIRESMFQNSNYTRIWDILTSYYEKVWECSLFTCLFTLLSFTCLVSLYFERKIFSYWTVTSS